MLERVESLGNPVGYIIMTFAQVVGIRNRCSKNWNVTLGILLRCYTGI